MAISSLNWPLILSTFAFDLPWGSLKRIETFNKNVCQDEKTDLAWVLLMISAQHTTGNKLA